MAHTLTMPKAKLNGTGVVRKPDGQIRHDDMVEELKPAKDNDDGIVTRIDDQDSALQHRG